MKLTAYLRSLTYHELVKVQRWITQELETRDKEFLTETMTNIELKEDKGD